MALNPTNKEVVDLAAQVAAQVAALTGETKTAAIRQALLERLERLQSQDRCRPRSLMDYLEHEVWPVVDPNLLGKAVPKKKAEKILGYGPDGI